MNYRRLIPLAFLLVLMVAPVFVIPQNLVTNNPTNQSGSEQETRIVDIGNGEFIELAPNEELHRFVLTEQGWTQWSGTISPLIGAEFGNSTNIFDDTQMTYIPGSGTSDFNAQVPIGTGWEAYEAQVSITGMTENRTWITNPGFQGGDSGWTSSPYSTAGYSDVDAYWVDDGHGSGDDCVEVDINSDDLNPPFYYDEGDRAWYRQDTTVDRGSVVWAGLRLDYWADTVDDTHYGMTGSFRIYAMIETVEIWNKVFSDIGAEETWYSSGLVSVNPTVFNLPGDTTVSTEVGLLSLASVGYAPNIHPRARFDNVELFLKTYVDASEINLEMNSLTISDGASRGICSITQIPGSPWTTSPVDLLFEWAPTPATPNPDEEIHVDLDIEVNMFARRLNIPSLSEINPTAYGERFTISNGTDARFTSYFRADIPDGYANLYYFNETLPLNRDVYFVAQPLAPTTNLTSGWSGGDVGDGYLDVTAYDITSEPGRYGYWRILSQSANMISDLELSDGGWTRNANFRAGDSSQIRVFVGASYTGAQVNFTVYEPDGSVWNTYTAIVDGAGYATTGPFTLTGASAPAGDWMVQAVTNDIGVGGDWTSSGFFKRPFRVTHASDLTLLFPSDAVSDMETNVTFGDLLLIILEAEDTDSSVLVPGGDLTLDWVLGTDTFDDNGNGQYTKVIDTSTLPGKGQYVMDLDWTHPSFDPSSTALTINVNYAATLTSPQYPGISGPIHDGQSFDVDFSNVNGTGIITSNVWCNWSNPYSMTPQGAGVYEFDLDMTGIPIGEYPVQVYASSPYVESQTLLMYVEVREIYNSITYTSSQLSIPVGEAASFLLTWTDTDHDIPITGSAASITCNWTDFHQSGDTNYTVVETVTPGVYNITIFTKNNDPLTVGDDLYTVTFDIVKSDYQTHTFDIGVEIRKRNTLFVLDAPVTQTPYGDMISVLVFYQDTDLRVGITNITGEVIVTLTSPGVTLEYTSTVSALGAGHYNITFLSDQWGSIGWKDLTIFIEWTGPVDKYYSQTIMTSVRVTGTDTDLYLEVAPTATYYQDSFNFTAVYWDAIGTQRISNGSDHVFVLITALDMGHSVTMDDFTIYESSSVPGTYIFLLDSSLFPDTQTFRFQLRFMWEKGVAPLYENQTMVVSLIVLDRPTHIEYSPVASTPYGETADLVFSYRDTLTNSKIPDSFNIQISINEPGVDYVVSYNAGTMQFTVSIDTSTLPGIGTHVLHLNVTWVGVPFYAAVSARAFTVTVTLRNTQLSHLSFVPPQWSNNVSIEFVYTDLVAGSTTGMTGTLTLDVGSSWYSVLYLGNGHFLVTLNTSVFASDGVYQLNATVVHTNPSYASAIEIFDISILKRSTQIGYDSPDPTPYQSNVTFLVTYIDDSTGRGIPGASVTASGNGTSSLVLNTNYWVTYQGSGQYLIEIDSLALGPPGPYLISVDVTYVGAPYYLPASIDVIARVTVRTTQILITQTPGDVPFLEDVVFRFKYEDFLLGTKISITKADITLSHGPTQIVIADGDYVLSEFATYYEITFASTILNPSALVTGYQIQLAIDTGGGAPYYAPRDTTTSVTTTERPTQILFPLVVDTPYYDNITIEITYIDFLSGTGIDGATLLITSVNGSVTGYQLETEANGVYRVFLNSSIFGDTGTVYFDITLSKAGSPFYASRTTLDVPATIKEIQTSLLAEAPPPGSTAVGVPIEVILTLRDFDHDVPLEGATISTNWTILHGTNYVIEELGDGEYKITLNTTGLLSERHEFQVWADSPFYQRAIVTVSIQPGAATVEIYLEKTAYYPDWGEVINITFQVREPYYNTPVPGMTGTLLWNGIVYPFTDLGNGYYTMDLDTSFEDFGIYSPQITVTKQYYQQRQRSFTLIVSKATGTILPEFSLYDVIIDTTSGFLVYLNDTVSNTPVVGATVTSEWNGTVYPMVTNGTAGWYSGSVDTTGFAIGPYLLTIRAVSTNHAFLESIIDINIVPIPTTLALADGSTLLTVFFGDTVDVLVVYNDTYHAALIADANVTYTLGSLTGQLTLEANNTYSAHIDVSSLASQSFYLRLVAIKDGYAVGLKSIIVTILPIPTSTSVDTTLNSAYFGDTVNFTFYYHDDQHDVPIEEANVVASWDGGGVPVVELGGGYYFVEVEITLTTPGLYDLVVRFDLTNYTARMITTKIEIYATPATILGPNEYNIPVNDDVDILYEVQNTRDDSQVTDVIGRAYSILLGEFELELQPSGFYALSISGTLPIGTYTFDISFTTGKYSIAPMQLVVYINPIKTELRGVGNASIRTSPGTGFEIELTFYDLDHGIAIPGANITVQYSQTNITYFEEYTTDENGVYTLYFQANEGRTFRITITFIKEDYVTQFVTFTIVSDISAAQQFQQALIVGGGAGLILVAMLIVAYVRVWSVPKQIRELNRMIRALAKGRVPKPASAPARLAIAMMIVNEEANALKVKKREDEIVEYPIETVVPEVNELLEELAAITGLGAVEIEAFKADLARMRASERPGFLKEVIEQEKARRADVLAKPPEGEPAPEEVPLAQRPEELEDLRQKLLKKGMAADEIDVIIEEAKSLSKADLDALLSSLGIDMD